MIRVDFHVHTIHSPDSVITFESLVEACHAKGIDGVAIMDHDVFDGAVEFAAKAEELRGRGEWAPIIIKGEEVRTTDGEICGLFLSERVPDRLSPLETMELIRGQGGLVYVPHPFDLLKLKRLRAAELERLADRIDIIEEFNGKPRLPLANVLARRFLRNHRFPRAAGSDAHEPTHLGAAYVELGEFEGPEALLENLGRGTVLGRLYSPFTSAWTRFRMRRAASRGS